MCENLLRYYKQNKLAVSLSIAGLTLALTSFIVIIAQVSYELTFDAHYENADRIFRAEYTDGTLEGLYESGLKRMRGDVLLASSPHIEVSYIAMAIREFTTNRKEKPDRSVSTFISSRLRCPIFLNLKQSKAT